MATAGAQQVSTERWHQIKSIVVRAMDASEREREQILSFECAGDPELRAEVDSLLTAARAADSLPEARAAIASATGSIVAEQDAALRSLLERVLSNQYEILRPIGRGGMGTVYLARERALDRFVAIKVLRPDLAIAEGHRERFRREARIAARLSHPGILGLHSFGEIDNLWYFVMTYVRGETLGERIRREGALPWTEAYKIFVQIADALDCAHRNGVIHRDIKPANILLDSDSGRAILADFGISKMPGASETITASGAILGTPVYMSPEQLAGGTEVDGRSDIYSLGIVAYLMLTGREPFQGDSPAGAVYRRLVDEPVPLESVASSVPAELASIVTRCIARQKANRWPDAQTLKAALSQIPVDERLPDLVRDVRSFGPYALLWAAGFFALAMLRERPPGERALLIVAALIAPLGLALHIWNGSRRGMRLIDLARPALYPPEWWTMWWPLPLRRSEDLWRRLPGPARAVRLVITASFPALFLLILVREGFGSSVFGNNLNIAEWAILGVASVVVVGGLIWARGKHLTVSQSLRILLGDTLDSPRWNDPAFRRVLLPLSGRVRDPDAETPSDYLRAIRELLPIRISMSGDAGLRACAAAERVLKEIDQRDTELAKLSRDAGPEEENRLASQLDALDAGGGDTEERNELRELVRHQLALVRRMRGRREVIMRDRAHLVDLLRGLWVLVQACGDDRGEDSLEIERLRALCADIRTELGTAAA
jgi:hypothetical protein